MQKRFLPGLIFSCVICTVLSCSGSRHAKSTRLPGNWQVQPIIVDGDSKDWPTPYPAYDEKAQLGYAVSNDKDNLYITVETGDLATQLKILREGLTVWIDRTGNKEEVTAINYPIPVSASQGDRPARQKATAGSGPQVSGNDGVQKQRLDLEDKVRAAWKDAKEFSLQGFKSCNLQFPVVAPDSCGIVVSLSIDADNEMVWEAKIPFRSFYFKPQVTRADKGKAMSICFETTGMKRPAGQPGGSRGSNGGFRPGIGFGVGGMGMGMGGGMYSGGGRRSGQNTTDIMEPAYKSTKTYKKFGIAYVE